jgi:hypothetical protein
MTTRRGFLGGLAGVLAAGFAPAAIGSGVLMPVRKIVAPSYTDVSVSLARYSQLYGEVEPGDYMVIVHPNEGQWWREQMNFIPVEQYARKVPLQNEIGSINSGRIRFIESWGPGRRSSDCAG